MSIAHKARILLKALDKCGQGMTEEAIEAASELRALVFPCPTPEPVNASFDPAVREGIASGGTDVLLTPARMRASWCRGGQT